jgi:AcrR family transcriptional regulator
MWVMEAEVLAAEDAAADGGAKRRQIMDGARTVFLSGGFDGASMNDVARAAGVSKGTIYAYFDSKEQLFEALVREDRGQQAERMCLFPREPGNPRVFLSEFGRRLVEMMTRPEMIAQLRVVIAATGKFPRLGRAFYDAGPCYGVSKLAEQLRALTVLGALEVVDAERAARQFIDLAKSGVFNAVLFGALESVPPQDIEASVNAAVDVFMRAYGPKT